MNINVPILEKTDKNINEDIKILSCKDIVNLEHIQAIRNAVKEHLLFIGLDRGNNIRNISVIGIGSNCEIIVDSKDIVRTALLSCSDKVVLVHNHPSNNTEPSQSDVHISNMTGQILKVFNIELLDHIIVTEKEYISMMQIKKINKDFTNDSISNMSKAFLIEENQKLKKQLEEFYCKGTINEGIKENKNYEWEINDY